MNIDMTVTAIGHLLGGGTVADHIRYGGPGRSRQTYVPGRRMTHVTVMLVGYQDLDIGIEAAVAVIAGLVVGLGPVISRIEVDQVGIAVSSRAGLITVAFETVDVEGLVVIDNVPDLVLGAQVTGIA